MLVQQRHEEAETSKLSINLFAGKKELSTEEGSKKEGTRNILGNFLKKMDQSRPLFIYFRLLKKWTNPGLFLFISVFSTWYNSNKNWKKQ